MNKKQAKKFDKAIDIVKNVIGSPTMIAMYYHQVTGEMISRETIRLWFKDRKVPERFAFVLYELTDYEIDPLDLVPWLREWVVLK